MEQSDIELTELVHGETCQKAEHVGPGYLHGEDDDGPYDVDGVLYCGRCHAWLAAQPTGGEQ